MLRNTNELQGYAIQATDGPIGHVKDFYFDDKAWVIRYLIIDTGTWLSSREVLVSPMALGQPNWSDEVLPASMTKEQVKNSPDIDTKKPVSRQHEIEYSNYYTYPYYWGGSGLWGGEMGPTMMLPGHAGRHATPHPLRTPAELAQERARAGDDPHLRSCKAVMGYHIHATDGDIGHVQSLLIDEETWAIRYLVVDTSNWWVGHKVLIVPQWVQDISWPNAQVSVNLSRQAIQDAPAYDHAAPFGRKNEDSFFKHYGRANYWDQ
jgi:sporulation protein YlmC with PRC-barrel domain